MDLVFFEDYANLKRIVAEHDELIKNMRKQDSGADDAEVKAIKH